MKRWFRRNRPQLTAEEKRAKAEARGRFTLTPPEGVPLNFQIAGVGARLGAQITDLLISGVFVMALVALLAYGLQAPFELVQGVAVLAFFLIRTPYYVFFELLWNGATLGKRMMGVRVVSADGRALNAHAVTVRNLMKEAEVFVPGTMLLASSGMDTWMQLLTLVWVLVCLITPVLNQRRQRLGDLIANTIVIERPVAALSADLALTPAKRKQEAFVFQPHQLEHYGDFEVQSLETLLQAAPPSTAPRAVRHRHAETQNAVVARIRAKIDYGDAVQPAEADAFLRAFYNSQRAHLEKRRLFGDRRADKFHKAGE